MGHRMKDEPHIWGPDCAIGFPADETPMYIYVRFSGIIKCPDQPPVFFETPPNDRTFKLTQDEILACVWNVTTGGWRVIFEMQFDPPNAHLNLLHLPSGQVFFLDTTDTPVDEGTVYNNNQRDCDFFKSAHGGIATVTWTQEATNLMAAINMQRGNDVFMELHPLVDGNKIYKFCRLKDATNIKIELEPD